MSVNTKDRGMKNTKKIVVAVCIVLYAASSAYGQDAFKRNVGVASIALGVVGTGIVWAYGSTSDEKKKCAAIEYMNSKHSGLALVPASEQITIQQIVALSAFHVSLYLLVAGAQWVR